MEGYRLGGGREGGCHPDTRWIERGEKEERREGKREDEGEVEANLSILEAPDRQTGRRQFAAGGNGFQYDQACQQIT